MAAKPETGVGIDAQDMNAAPGRVPYNAASFEQIRVTELWRRYDGRLHWGQGQCLAILDDGCDLSDPPWQVQRPWGPKVVATYNSIDDNDDPTPVPPGYHGTSVGYPSSLQHQGVHGIAYNNSVAQVRCVAKVHLDGQTEAATMAAALRWVLAERQRLNITAVNLSPLDDQPHQEPVPTVLDAPLKALRQAGVWVSAPCGNHGYTDGISWPACQPYCYGIGATEPGRHAAHLDRWAVTDLLVAATATSSSNAYAAAAAMVLREAIETADYPWQQHGPNLADATLAIFKLTGVPVDDPASGCRLVELDLLAAVAHVL